MLGMRRFSQMSMNVRRVMTALLLLTVAYPEWANEAAGDPAPSQSSAATTKDLKILRPFGFGGLALGGATYDVFAGEIRTGVEVETKSLVFVTDFGPWNSRSMRPQAKSGSPAFDQNGNRPGGEVALWLPSPATNRHVLLRRREHQSLSSHSRKYKSRGLLKLPCDMALLTC